MILVAAMTFRRMEEYPFHGNHLEGQEAPTPKAVSREMRAFIFGGTSLSDQLGKNHFLPGVSV